MKKLILLFSLFAGTVSANAQAMSHGKWEENASSGSYKSTHSQIKLNTPRLYEGTEMNESNGMLSFTNLPEMKNGTWAIVTDVNGNVLTQKRVTPIVNFMDVGRLAKDAMYFVTLTYKSKSQKAFVLHL